MGGTISFKVKTGETHVFQMSKSKLLQVTALIQMRMEACTNTLSKTHAAKVRKLLQKNTDYGVSDMGFLTKERGCCCKNRVISLPWTSIVSIRMVKNCSGGQVRIGTVSDVVARRPLQEMGKVTKSSRGNYEPEEVSKHDEEFKRNLSHRSITFKLYRSTAEALYEDLSAIMCEERKDMDEEDYIHTQLSHTRTTNAGMRIETKDGHCGGFSKVFIPWGSVNSITHTTKRNNKEVSFHVHDRLQEKTDLGLGKFKDYEKLRSLFSAKVAEFKVPTDQTVNLEELVNKLGAKRGLAPMPDGIHELRKMWNQTVMRTFVPWSRFDGIVVDLGGCCKHGTVCLVTESGERLQVAHTAKTDLLWEIYEQFRLMKYGKIKYGNGSEDEVNDETDALTFNDNADKHKTVNDDVDERREGERKSCKLTNESLKFCMKKGRIIEEIDLERVIDARRSSETNKKQLEVAFSVGITKSSRIEKLPLNENDDAEKLAYEIKRRAEARKKIIRQHRQYGFIN